MVEQKSQQEIQQADYQQQQEACEHIKLNVAQIQLNINFYEEHLQSLQNSLNEVRQKLEELEGSIVNQTENDKIQQLIVDINRMIADLVVSS